MQPGRAKESSEQERAAQEREKRIADIKRQVEAGTYQVNSEELSRAIVRKHLKKSEG